MEFLYLKKTQVMAMHEILIQRYGGTLGIRDEGLLESALAQPRQSAFGEDIYPDVFAKAACYGFGISENQPFLDGNKRSAASAIGVFMKINGYDLTCSPLELYEAIMGIATKKTDRKTLAKWLKKNSKAIKKHSNS
jgi:death-on-curing protein